MGSGSGGFFLLLLFRETLKMHIFSAVDLLHPVSVEYEVEWRHRVPGVLVVQLHGGLVWPRGSHWWQLVKNAYCPNLDFEGQVVSFAVNPGWFSFYSLVSEWIILTCVGLSFLSFSWISLTPPWNGVPCKLSYLNVSLAYFGYLWASRCLVSREYQILL